MSGAVKFHWNRDQTNPHGSTETKLPSQTTLFFICSFIHHSMHPKPFHLSCDQQARCWLGKQRKRQSTPWRYQMLGVLVEEKSLRAGQRAPEEQVTVQNSKKASQQPAHLDIPKAGESRGGEKIWGQCWSVFFKLQPQFLKQTHCFVSLGIPGH